MGWSSVDSVITRPLSGELPQPVGPLLPELRPAATPSATMSRMDWVCEHCGTEGESSAPVDEVQCPACGEPVTPR